MAKTNLQDVFLHDSLQAIEQLNAIFVGLESNKEDKNRIHEAFRLVHSIKSESGYLEYAEVSSLAHEMESVLARARDAGGLSENDDFDFLFSTLDKLQNLVGAIPRAVPDDTSEDVADDTGDRDLESVDAETIAGDEETDAVSSRSVGIVPAMAPVKYPETVDLTDIMAGSDTAAPETAAPPEDFVEPGIEDPSAQSEREGEASRFSDDELMLLEEAALRGEQFYRIRCRIGTQAPMDYARAYLIVNNLEIAVNVIRSMPDVATQQEADYSTLTVYFTTDLDEEAISGLVNVDEVERTELLELDYSLWADEKTVVSGDEAAESGEVEPSRDSLRVPVDELKSLQIYSDELQFQLLTIPDQPGDFKRKYVEMRKLIEALSRKIRDIQRSDLTAVFGRLSRMVRDLGRELEKPVDFSCSGEDLVVDRHILQILPDVLTHLVRNAIDHGLESPEERVRNEKPMRGTIQITVEKTADSIHIVVADDGRGVDEDAARKRAAEFGVEDSANLFEILSSPGFSTKKEASSISGRGVGLDVVRERISRIEGAFIRMETEEGKGSRFHLDLPEVSRLSLLFITARTQTYAVPRFAILDTAVVDPSLYRRGSNGRLYYDGKPVFTVEGRLVMPSALPSETCLIHMSHLGVEGVLIADDILFMRDIPEERIRLSECDGPHIRSIAIDGVKMDYLYLSPSILTPVKFRRKKG